MAQNPLMKLMDAGMAFTQMTQAKAEAIVKDLVAVGAVRVEEAQHHVSALLDKGRETSEMLVTMVRNEVQRQMQALGLTSAPTARKVASTPVAATKARAESAPAKKVAAPKKVAVKKAPAAKKAAAAKKAGAARDAAGVRKVAAKKATSTARATS